MYVHWKAKRKFDWDHANRDHLAEHDVTPEEFEQIFDHPRFERTVERKGEKRKWCLGQTDAGRLINAVYPERRERISRGDRLYDEPARKEVL